MPQIPTDTIDTFPGVLWDTEYVDELLSCILELFDASNGNATKSIDRSWL